MNGCGKYFGGFLVFLALMGLAVWETTRESGQQLNVKATESAQDHKTIQDLTADIGVQAEAQAASARALENNSITIQQLAEAQVRAAEQQRQQDRKEIETWKSITLAIAFWAFVITVTAVLLVVLMILKPGMAKKEAA